MVKRAHITNPHLLLGQVFIRNTLTEISSHFNEVVIKSYIIAISVRFIIVHILGQSILVNPGVTYTEWVTPGLTNMVNAV